MSIESIFNEKKIPEAFDVPRDKKYDTYLVNGELKKWEGPSAKVYSPIYTPNKKGELKPTLLGSLPVMGESEAMTALDAANEAFKNGTGKWPTLRVEERIKCV